MAREIPEVVRAAAGLAATVLDEARKLPETLPGIPVRLIGLAMQHAMKVQQQYAGFVARGDELFTGLRGENEPGMATFDDDIEPVTVTQPSNGYRESAFDRADGPAPLDETLTDDEVEALPADPHADAVTAVVDELAGQVESGRQSIEELVEEAPAIEQILDEIAIDELVDQAPTLEETSPGTPALSVVQDVPAQPEQPADESTSVDVVTPDGEIATVEAAVTDEGIAAPESPEAVATPAAAKPEKAAKAPKPRKPAKAKAGKELPAEIPETPATAETTGTDNAAAPAAVTDESGTTAPAGDAQGPGEPSGSQPAGAAPIDGYDSFSIAQLRGRLRGYALSTVQDLLAYEQATRAREPFLQLLRNRLEKLEQRAVESSPLAPRGA